MKTLADLRIIFMGTPEFAVASLDKLVTSGCRVVAVVTAPDKAAGRGLALQQSPVKKYAVEKNIPVLQPEKLKNPEFVETLRSYQADLQVVVAFRMLPEIVWNMPPLGTINVHGSLLPQYRGAAPINWAVINGEKETGVTTFKLKHDIDTGNILLSQIIPIADDETAGELHDDMKETGAKLLLETLERLASGNLIEKPQPVSVEGEPLKHAPKIYTETCKINWNKSVDDVFNLIRGLSPYPGAFTELEGKKLKIFKAHKLPSHEQLLPGKMETDQKTFIRFTCSNGRIEVLSLQLEGKKKMDIGDFLRGYKFKN